MTKRFEITDNMAKGFAAEIENNIEKINSKGGMPFLNYVLHMKGGKTEQISENTTRKCVTLSLLVPFKIEGITDKKKRPHVIFENGKFPVDSAKNILRIVVDAVENFEYHLKRYKDDSMLGYKNTFKEVVEQYGFEDLEKRIADFFEYLTNLGGSEVYDAPMLNEGETESNICLNKISRVEYLKMSRDVSDYILKNGKNSDWKTVDETLKKLLRYYWGDIEGADEKISSIGKQLYSIYTKVDDIINWGYGAYPALLENALLQSKL